MSGHTYVTEPYYNYNDFPAQEGGYAYEPEQHGNWYVVETTTVERVRAPPSGYTKFGGAPLKNDLLKENKLNYAPTDRHEGYEPLYGSNYENSSPSRYHEGGNLMANFLNKLQIGATHKHRPTSPGKYRPKSPNKYQPTSPNKYHPTDPINHRPKSPNKYGSTSPNKYRPKSPNKYKSTSPNKYLPTSPSKYHPKSPNKSRPTSPNKYRPKSPNKYRPTSPNKYRPTSPNKYRPSSPSKHRPISPNMYRPSSPEKYQPTGPSKYQPTSSTYTYPSKEANMMKPQTLPGPNKYRPTSPTKYRPRSPTPNYPSKEDHINMPQNMPDLNKYRPTSPVHKFPSKQDQPIRTQSLKGPNKNHSSSMGVERDRHDRVLDFSNPNYHWQSAGPPTTRSPLMAPTNDINEALGFLVEQVNYPRAQPIEHEGQYARPTFRGATNRPYLISDTIDSHEALRRYNGAYVP